MGLEAYRRSVVGRVYTSKIYHISSNIHTDINNLNFGNRSSRRKREGGGSSALIKLLIRIGIEYFMERVTLRCVARC